MSWTYFLRFMKTPNFQKYFQKTLFRQKCCHIILFFKFLKIRDSSFVAPSILRLIMPKIGPSLKTVPGTTILAEPYFASKHDVTLTSFPADL